MDIVISVRAESIIAKLAGAPDKLREALRQAVTNLTIDIQSSVKRDKLTGQVLHTGKHGGTLRRSINREVQERVDGVFGIVGTNIFYGKIHEYGGSFIAARRKLKLPPHLVRRRLGERVMTGSPYGIFFPERSFLRSTLKDFEPRIREDLRAAALNIVR